MPSINWTEDYKPRSFSRSDFVLPEEHRQIFEEYSKGRRAQHLLLTGTYGTGKTTAGQILRKKSQSEFFISCPQYKTDRHWQEGGKCWKQIFVSQLTGFSPSEKRVRPIKKFVLLDEFEQLKDQKLMRGILDEAANRQIILCMTSNYPEKIDPAIKSRSLSIHFGKGDSVWDNIESDNPPGSRDDIEDQIINFIFKIIKKETKGNYGGEENIIYLRDKILAKNYPDIRGILVKAQTDIHDGKFSPPENKLKKR